MNVADYVLNYVKNEKPIREYIQTMDELAEHRHLIFDLEPGSKIYTVITKDCCYYSDPSGLLFGKVDIMTNQSNTLNYYLDYHKFYEGTENEGKSKVELLDIFLKKNKKAIVVDNITKYLDMKTIEEKVKTMKCVYQHMDYMQSSDEFKKFILTVRAKIVEFIQDPYILLDDVKEFKKMVIQFKKYFPDILTEEVLQKLGN